MINLKIDPEFQALIPPLTDDEFKRLRDNIIEDGEVREPIVTWNGVILDGHNRWSVIQENPDIPFKTMEMIFLSRNEAKVWMIRNQLGRRNLPPFARGELAMKLEPLVSADAEQRKLSTLKQNVNSSDNPTLDEREVGSTLDKLAEAARVSHGTMGKIKKITEKAAPEVKEQLRKGEISINKAYTAIREAEREQKEPPKETPKAPEYTVDNLVQEITTNAETFVKFLRSTLANRNAVYADTDSKVRVLKAVQAVKENIETIENLLK